MDTSELLPEYVERKMASRDIPTVSNFLPKIIFIPEVKKKGGLNEITDIRREIASWLGIPFMQLAALTKGWSIEVLQLTFKQAQSFTKNPQACWWVIYKKQKSNYERQKRIDQGRLSKMGEEGGLTKCEERQPTLF